MTSHSQGFSGRTSAAIDLQLVAGFLAYPKPAKPLTLPHNTIESVLQRTGKWEQAESTRSRCSRRFLERFSLIECVPLPLIYNTSLTLPLAPHSFEFFVPPSPCPHSSAEYQFLSLTKSHKMYSTRVASLFYIATALLLVTSQSRHPFLLPIIPNTFLLQ